MSQNWPIHRTNTLLLQNGTLSLTRTHAYALYHIFAIEGLIQKCYVHLVALAWHFNSASSIGAHKVGHLTSLLAYTNPSYSIKS